MCLFNCNQGNCKTGAPHYCDALNQYRKTNCPKLKTTKCTIPCISCGRDTSETKRDECKTPSRHVIHY